MFKFMRRLIVTAVVLGTIFVAVGLVLPAKIHVERSAVIQAPAADIFPYVNDFRRFNEWNPWAARDPNTKYAFTGPESGQGAGMTWQSDDPNVGAGSQTIVESIPNERVSSLLDFGQMGRAQAFYRLETQDGGTKVTWGFDTVLPYNPVTRWMGLLIDRWIGADYEEGLARLKKKVETGSV